VPRYFFTRRGRGRVKDDPHGTNYRILPRHFLLPRTKFRSLEKRAGTPIPL
jgi:hypothetical protein